MTGLKLGLVGLVSLVGCSANSSRQQLNKIEETPSYKQNFPEYCNYVKELDEYTHKIFPSDQDKIDLIKAHQELLWKHTRNDKDN